MKQIITLLTACLIISCQEKGQTGTNETLHSIMNRTAIRSYQDQAISADTIELLLGQEWQLLHV